MILEILQRANIKDCACQREMIDEVYCAGLRELQGEPLYSSNGDFLNQKYFSIIRYISYP